MTAHPDRPMSTDEKPSEELMQLFWGKCTCLDDYTKRKLTDPQCVRCNYEDAALLSRCLASRTATGDGALRKALKAIQLEASNQDMDHRAFRILTIEVVRDALAAAPTHDAVRDAALEEAAKECDRHAAFCKDEAHKGGAWDHLMTRNDEAAYNAERIRRLKSPTVEKKA